MSRRKIAITLDPENVEWLDEHCDNRSGFINDLLSRARNNEDAIEHVVARYRKEQLRAEKATLEARMEGINEQLDELDERIDVTEDQEAAKLDEAMDALDGAPPDPSNPAVQNWSEKLDMSPQQLAEQLEAAD